MFKKQLTKNIKDLDLKISKLTNELEELEGDENNYDSKMNKLEKLIELRCKLSESKVNNSVKPLIVSGLFGLTSVVVVLKYEQTEVITSKAFNMATSMFRGSK